MVFLEKPAKRQVTSCNYITSVNGMPHPDRIMEEHDFLYILEGDWEIYEDGILYEMHSDDLLILKAGAHHYGVKPCNPGNRHMYFHTPPTEEEKNKSHPGEKGREIGSLIHCAGAPQVRRYFQDLIAVYWSDGANREEQISLLVNLIISIVFELDESSYESIIGDTIVEDVCRKLRTSPQCMFTAQELSKEYFICARTLNNRFIKAFGKSFHDYQADLKLNMIQQYLRCQPEVTLKEAAMNFGFCDEFHLSHAFKKKFGVSPTEYRNRSTL